VFALKKWLLVRGGGGDVVVVVVVGGGGGGGGGRYRRRHHHSTSTLCITMYVIILKGVFVSGCPESLSMCPGVQVLESDCS